jgi:hypothetical protein
MLHLIHAQHHYPTLSLSGPLTADKLGVEVFWEEDSKDIFDDNYITLDKFSIEVVLEEEFQSLSPQDISVSILDRVNVETLVEEVDDTLNMVEYPVSFGSIDLDHIVTEAFYEEDVTDISGVSEYVYLDHVVVESFYEEHLTNDLNAVEYVYLDSVVMESFYEEDPTN